MNILRVKTCFAKLGEGGGQREQGGTNPGYTAANMVMSIPEIFLRGRFLGNKIIIIHFC